MSLQAGYFISDRLEVLKKQLTPDVLLLPVAETVMDLRVILFLVLL